MNAERPGPSAQNGTRVIHTLPGGARYEHAFSGGRTSGVLVGHVVHASFDRLDPVVRSGADEEDDSTHDLGSLRLSAEPRGGGVGGRGGDADVHALALRADADVVGAGALVLDPLAAQAALEVGHGVERGL